ncbi:Retrovirus-related Pol polyprotein from transposon TNT 1-94 [Linum perenne]
MYVRGRGKIGYLTGAAKKPEEGKPEFDVWDAENSMVMTWLVNSMTTEIGTNYLGYATAKELWDDVNSTYSDMGNQSQVYDLTYYNTLKQVWQDLEQFNDYVWKSNEDYLYYKKTVDTNRIFKFLVGLNAELDEVRGRIIGRDPLPPIAEVFNEVRREETRRRVMLGSRKEVQPVEGSAFQAVGGLLGPAPEGYGVQRQRGHDPKAHLRCDFCGKRRHVREDCWKLRGKQQGKSALQDSGGRSGDAGYPRANAAGTQGDEGVLTKEQLEQLLSLLKPQFAQAGTSSSSAAPSGNGTMTLSACTEFSVWVLDSGATDHMTNQPLSFVTYTSNTGFHKVKIANGNLAPIVGQGHIPISKSLTLKSVLHVPKLTCNLLSIRKLTKDSNCIAVFYPFHCEIQDLSSRRVIGSCKLKDGLYYLDSRDFGAEKCQGLACTSSIPAYGRIMLYHSRLGHPSFPYLRHLFPSLFRGINMQDLRCESCQYAKNHKAVFAPRSYSPSKPFYLIHSDVWGPSKVKTLSEKRWFITFIDDHTRMCWVYFFKHKYEVEEIFKQFYNMIFTQFHTAISVLRTDNGTEFFNSKMSDFLLSKGIIHQSSCPNTPQQNGVAERKNRHVLEVARALMFSANLPKYFWGDAVLTATYLINRLPSKTLSFLTPLQCLQNVFPTNHLVSDIPLKMFGCTCFVLIPPQFRTKLDPRSVKRVFLGYASNKKGYKCFDPTTRKTFHSMDVVFWENQFYYPKISLQGENLNGTHEIEDSEGNFWEVPDVIPVPVVVPTQTRNDLRENDGGKEDSMTGGEVQEKVFNNTNSDILVYTRRHKNTRTAAPESNLPANHPDDSNNEGQGLTSDLAPQPEPNPQSDLPIQTTGNPETSQPDLGFPIALRKGTRACTRYPVSRFLSYAKLSTKYKAFVSNVSNLFVPRTIKEALNDAGWTSAVKEEMRALIQNDTWSVVELPTGKKPVGCKWVFTIKCKADGSVERYKARLVAKGFTQTYGIDYTETFAPVAKINSIRVILSIAVNNDWPLYQLDVKNAFLNGKLEEEVYMNLPPGFEEKFGMGKVCKLKRSLYGLKQSPRAWFDRFWKAIKKYGFCQSQADHTLFYKRSIEGKMVVLIVYVDYIVVTGDDGAGIDLIKKQLATEFEVKDLGILRYFLGMEFARTKEGLFINQRKYVLDLLAETGMTGCKPAETPMDSAVRLRPSESHEVKDQERYQRLVGKLIYLAHTRPDITFAVSVVSQFMHSPGASHFDAVYRIIRYLKGSPGKGLMFRRRGNLQVEVYTDADWAGDVNDRRSTSGYCTFIGGNLVSWRSKKQPVVTRSSAEAEFRAIALGICEVVWVRRILKELQLPCPAPIKVYSDSKAAVAIAHNPVLHDRTKHVEIDKHFIKEKLDSGLICMPYISTTHQIADVLTKSLPRGQFSYLVNKLAMEDIYAPA